MAFRLTFFKGQFGCIIRVFVTLVPLLVKIRPVGRGCVGMFRVGRFFVSVDFVIPEPSSERKDNFVKFLQ